MNYLCEQVDYTCELIFWLLMKRINEKVKDVFGRIEIIGAREHNLKNINVQIPRNSFVVLTGVSGSGKSTLAFDLLFAEGQHRFLDSLSTYARQYVEQLPRPEVDYITGLPPSVSIEQRTSRGGGKSTVATVTEVQHFFRLLYSRAGVIFCPDCQIPVGRCDEDDIIDQVYKLAKDKARLSVFVPLIKNKKGTHAQIISDAISSGLDTFRVDGKIYKSKELPALDRYKEHNLEVETGKIDRTDIVYISQIIRRALEMGNGEIIILGSGVGPKYFSTIRACPVCGLSVEELDPRLFSYNSPHGWCPKCRGFGEIFYLPDVDRGARAGAIEESWYEWMEGKREICPACNGTRLNRVARSVRLPVIGARDAFSEFVKLEGISDENEYWPRITDFGGLSVKAVDSVLTRIKFDGRARLIAQDIIPEIRARLKIMIEVGLGYLQLDRSVPTLSGGEAQRIRLAAQLGSSLSGVLYILDEPTIGLHPYDNQRLIRILKRLKDRGNSVVVVEHDEAMIRSADYIIDLGPGGGVNGGRVVACGSVDEIIKNKDSITGRYLRSGIQHPARLKRRPVDEQVMHRLCNSTCRSDLDLELPDGYILLQNARMHNLKNISISIPLGRLVVITGVSGSGKSTLVNDCLLTLLLRAINSNADVEDPVRGKIRGAHQVSSVHVVDQSPIGRTPRSVPATYIGFFTQIRELYAQTPEAKMRGYGAGRFSFNSPDGRCPECSGAGAITVEMNFLPSAFIKCQLCNGTRFNPEILDVLWHGKSIAQVLEMSVSEAREFFESIPQVFKALRALEKIGLGYLKLGQPSPTLSGGEAQRIKLITHLLSGYSARNNRRTVAHNLYILEEPTTGLHTADVVLLIEALHELVELGHTVIVIEHNIDVIAEADWIIDLGPSGGDAGGYIVAQGTPDKVAADKNSRTGMFLKSKLCKH